MFKNDTRTDVIEKSKIANTFLCIAYHWTIHAKNLSSSQQFWWHNFRFRFRQFRWHNFRFRFRL